MRRNCTFFDDDPVFLPPKRESLNVDKTGICYRSKIVLSDAIAPASIRSIYRPQTSENPLESLSFYSQIIGQYRRLACHHALVYDL